MSQELLHIAQQVITTARKQGAKDVRALVYRANKNKVEWRDGKLDRLRESTRMGLSVSLYVDGRYSANTTSDLRPAALEQFLAENIAMTRLLAADPHRQLPDPRRYANQHRGDLQLFDSTGISRLTAAERRRLAEELEQAARAHPEAGKIISVTSACASTHAEQALMTSNGMQGTQQETSFYYFTETSVQGENNRKPEGYDYYEAHRLQDLPAPAKLGQEATRRALQEIGARPEKSGQYPCVIENRMVERLIYDLIRPLQGSAIQQRRSFLADKLGQKIASPLLTLIDDPWRPGGMSSQTYDSEGMSTVRRPIIERGVLRSFFLDTYYGSKLKKEPTIGQPTNLVFTPGSKDLAGLLKAMKRGILITDFSGGNTNAATGDFSVGIRGLWIEDGQPRRPVAEMNLAGNHLELWTKLQELGNDIFTSSSTMAPSVRFAPLQFSGV